MRPKPPARSSLDQHLTYRLNTLSKLNDMASQALYGAQTGLTLPEVRALAAVGAFDDVTVNGLALEVNLDKGQASRLAAAMAAKGWLERSPDPKDRRVLHLRLTDAGRELWQRVMPLIDQRNQDLLNGLTALERQQLLDLLDKLLAQEKARSRPRG